ncbi:MAG: hypothetical protein AAF478_09065 [Pseudomonadota bacterium]
MLPTHPQSKTGTAEAIVLIKAAPVVSSKYGETVCCAAVDLNKQWLRLYPVSFRYLEHDKKFGRWDKIKFGWRLPNDDNRIESRRINQDTLEIIGTLKKRERQTFLSSMIVTSLDRERQAERSLALLSAEINEFTVAEKTNTELDEALSRLEALRNQNDLFAESALLPYQPCPYKFGYRYTTDDGLRNGTCQDWEMEATFFRLRSVHGEETALKKMRQTFGEDYPNRGMLLAMGTHSRFPDTWLINGVVRLDPIIEPTLL